MDRDYGTDKERLVKKGIAWDRFKAYLAEKNKDLNIEALLKKPSLKKDPVVSYGIIEFVLTPTSAFYHVYQRRHTLEYDILVKGFAARYQLYDMVALISQDERDRIINNDWRTVWDDLWIDHTERGYLNLQSQSERRFEELKDVVRIVNEHLPCSVETRSHIFPKGKPNKNETGLEAALREAREETKNPFNTGELYFESPIVQNYIGSDDRKYTDYYYVWRQQAIYNSPVQKLPTVNYYRTDGVNEEILTPDTITRPLTPEWLEQTQLIRKETQRLRPTTISYDFESDAWLELPIFDTVREKLEWQQSIDPYADLGIFSRHFTAILTIHNSLRS